MDDYIRNLGMTLDRATGTAVPYYPHHAQGNELREEMQRLARAVISAEQATGYEIDPHIKLPRSAAEISDRETSKPRLEIGQRYLSHEMALTQDELEGLVLHEFGHKFYYPVSDCFKNAHELQHMLGEIQRLAASAEKDPATFATSVFHRYEPQAFADDLQRLTDELLAHAAPLTSPGNAARTATIEQCAAWLAASHRELQQHGRLADNPLSLYATLPATSAETDALLSRITSGYQRSYTQAVPTAQDQQIILDAVESAARSASLFRWDVSKPLRAEEFLCDDFAVMRATDPRAVSTRQRKQMSGRIEYAHPYMGERAERSAALAEEVCAARELFSAKAHELGGSLRDKDSRMQDGWVEKVIYSSWVQEAAAEAEETQLARWHF